MHLKQESTCHAVFKRDVPKSKMHVVLNGLNELQPLCLECSYISLHEYADVAFLGIKRQKTFYNTEKPAMTDYLNSSLSLSLI